MRKKMAPLGNSTFFLPVHTTYKEITRREKATKDGKGIIYPYVAFLAVLRSHRQFSTESTWRQNEALVGSLANHRRHATVKGGCVCLFPTLKWA